MVVNTVGCQYEHIADFERHDAIVDLDPRIHAQSAAEIGFLGRNDDTVIVGQLLQPVARYAIYAGIADVEDMGGARFEHHCVEGADVAFVFIVGILAAPALRVQP